MIFSTPLFIFIFLPAFLGIYYLTPFKYRTYVILAGSWIFYGFWRIDFLCLVILTTAFNYYFGIVLDNSKLDEDGKKRILFVSVIANLAILGYFKYFNFGIDSMNALLKTLGAGEITATRVILPVGISFYIFQSLSYVIDVYRKDAPSSGDFITLAAYIALFPQLIAGPILRYKDVASQFRKREHSVVLFGEGFLLFASGLGRKVLIADTLAPLVNSSFGLASPSFADAWLGTAAYAVQLYFDFSGYSDMAIGLGMMIGFRFQKNFDAPYVSSSITEFWQRWHISLSSWLRDYLYIPLGGNRKGLYRTYVNLMTVMVLGGLWHGAAWNFALWGVWHGVWLIVERMRKKPVFPTAAGWTRTMLIVLTGWVFFRAENMSGIINMLRGMAGLNGFPVSASLNWQISRFSIAVLFIAAAVLFFEGEKIREKTMRFWAGIRPAVLFGFCCLSVFKLLADSYSPFLYFRF